jgi:hypothetical protein
MSDCGVTGNGDGEHDEHRKATELDAVGDEGDGNLMGDMSAYLPMVRALIEKRTGSGSCHGIRNDGPELDFVGIGRNLKSIDNRRQLLSC